MTLASYQLYYSENGELNTICDHLGRQLYFRPKTKTFNEKDPLTKQLRLREKETGQKLDLSDRVTEDALADAIARKQKEIVEAAREQQESLTKNYAFAERDSWKEKYQEALKIIASKDIKDAPYLKVEAIATTGITEERAILAATIELAQAVKAKADLLRKATAQTAGERTRLCSLAAVATNLEEVATIAWED